MMTAMMTYSIKVGRLLGGW